MILIVSKEKLEPSTEDVMDWLEHYKVPFLRFNGDAYQKKTGVSIELSNASEFFSVGKLDPIIASGNFNSAWFRRWCDEDFIDQISSYEPDLQKYQIMTSVYKSDQFTLASDFFSKINVKNWLTNPAKANLNKITVLRQARQLGIHIPATLVTTSKKDVADFKNKHDRIISKDLSIPYYFNEEDGRAASYTFEVDEATFAKIPDSFATSLFQELIVKKYEIRAFYLDGKIYSMAIFSQSETQTSLDFRKYTKKGNRTVPYELPEDLSNKLIALMDMVGLNTGSIDIIKTVDDRYVFLEINPVGQFGMTSSPCNYYLEKIIAEYLIKKYEE